MAVEEINKIIQTEDGTSLVSARIFWFAVRNLVTYLRSRCYVWFYGSGLGCYNHKYMKVRGGPERPAGR